jgi:hypothetical protein
MITRQKLKQPSLREPTPFRRATHQEIPSIVFKQPKEIKPEEKKNEN